MQHVLFWFFYYFIFSAIVVFGIYQVRDVKFYVGLIPIYLLDIALVYFNFYILMPWLLGRRKYITYGIGLALAIITTG